MQLHMFTLQHTCSASLWKYVWTRCMWTCVSECVFVFGMDVSPTYSECVSTYGQQKEERCFGFFCDSAMRPFFRWMSLSLTLPSANTFFVPFRVRVFFPSVNENRNKFRRFHNLLYGCMDTGVSMATISLNQEEKKMISTRNGNIFLLSGTLVLAYFTLSIAVFHSLLLHAHPSCCCCC